MWEDGIFTTITCPEVPQNNSHYFHQTRVKHNPQCPSTTTQPGPLDQVSVCTYMYIDKRSKRRKQNKNCCMQVPSNRPLRFLHLKFHATLHKYEYGLHSTYEHLQTTKLFKKSLFKIPSHQYYCIKKKQQPPLDTFSPSSNDGSSLLLDTINRVTRFSPIPSYFLPCVVRPIFANPTIFLGSSLSLSLLAR